MERMTASLDGTWSVVFDEQNVGKRKKYYDKMPKGQPIQVPGVWEQVRGQYDGVGWYERTFDAPAEWLDGTRTVRMRFGAVNYFAEVWVNGRKAGEHEGGYTPFELDVTKLLSAGENKVSVRVIDPPRRKEIEGFRSGAPLSQAPIPTWKAGWYWNFGGIWQSVELIVTPRTYIKHIFVEPLPDEQTAKVHVTVVAAAAGKAALAVEVAPWKKGKATTGGAADKRVALKKGERTVKIAVPIENMQWWDCENPFLYVASVALESADGEDALATRFGMRVFNVEGGHYCLNHKRIVLKGYLQQGAYPSGLALPPSDEMVRREVEMAKENGMNFIRMHIKPDPFTPPIADELGVLLVAEPPAGWVANTPMILPRSLRETEELVLRDRNHPSIVMWCMLNEIYHYWSFTNAERDRFRKTISRHARKFDPTRIIGDNSGGCHKKDECAGGMMPYTTKYVPMRDLHAYCGRPVTPATLERSYRNLPAKGGPIYISEFGAMECPPDWDATLARYSAADRKAGVDDYVQYKGYADSFKQRFSQAGLSDTFKDWKAYVAACDAQCGEDVRAMVSAIRVNPNTDAYAICQLADASGEIFGVTDIWRQPKAHMADYVEAAGTPWLVPHLKARILEPGGELPVVLDCVNEHETGRKYRAIVTIRPDGGGRAQGKPFEKSFTARQWVDHVGDVTFKAPARGGRYVVEAVLKEGARVRCTNRIRFSVVEPAELAHTVFEVPPKMDEITDVLKPLGATFNRLGNGTAYKHNPFVFTGRGIEEDGPRLETIQQVSRQVRLGGVAVIFQPRTPLFYDHLLPSLIRLTVPMRNLGYVRSHPITEGLPTGMLDYELGEFRRKVHNLGEDVLAAGGTSIIGGIGANMWTKPDVYHWISQLDEIPVGRGKVILVQIDILGHARTNPAARRLLVNLLNYAAASIKPGLEDRCVGRCIDPID